MTLDRIDPPDLDADHTGAFSSLDPRLVFIVGLHRSGTTFLYRSMAEAFGLAPVRVHHVVFFPRLVHDHLEGQTDARFEEIRAYFEAHGIDTRLSDAIELGPRTVEEYGWILKRWGGSFQLDPRSRPTFDALVRKLAFLSPDSRGVLLKNPWDTVRVPWITERFPDARFVFIDRDPVEILDSQLRNAVRFGRGRDPLLYLMLNGNRLGKAVIGAERASYKLIGERWYKALMARLLASDIRTQRQAWDEALEAVPAERRICVTYDGLVDDTQAALDGIGAFLGQEVGEAARSIRGQRRGTQLDPVVERLRHRFARE